MDRVNTNRRRLGKLETQLGAAPEDVRNERESLEWLSTPSVLTVIAATARITAERRWLFEHGRAACGRDPWGGVVLGREHGWLWLTDDETRDALTLAEIERLDHRLADRPFFDAVREWCDDDDCLVPYWHATDDDRFRDQLRRDRSRMAIQRGQQGGISNEWRRRNPEWRRDMTEADYDTWELEALNALRHE